MNVVVEIEGREAIPVRAIPLLTDWETMSPDALATVLAGRGLSGAFSGLEAHRVEDGQVLTITSGWWSNIAVPEFESLTDTIRSEQISDATGYHQWQQESLNASPSGVFVWKDEYVARYELDQKLRVRMSINETGVSPYQALPLDFSPFIPDVEWQEMVMEGFEAQDAPQMSADESDELGADRVGLLPLTTGDIAFCFGGIHWTEQKWKKPLGDKPQWLAACVAIPGVRGVSETRWNPVYVGAALVNRGHTGVNSVRAKFQTQPLLHPWLDAWKTYEADNFDTA